MTAAARSYFSPSYVIELLCLVGEGDGVLFLCWNVSDSVHLLNFEDFLGDKDDVDCPTFSLRVADNSWTRYSDRRRRSRILRSLPYKIQNKKHQEPSMSTMLLQHSTITLR
eukprot:m.154227 g.154227  ORF g.154227 m.154227 type:complete len:111 (-) comp13313_c1_seq38:458-790(-)